MGHSCDLLIYLGLGYDFRQILQDERSSREVRVFGKDVGYINPAVSTYVDNKCRAVVQLGPGKQLVRVVYLGPWSLPRCPGLHVAVEGFIVSGALLESSKEVKAFTVGV